MDKFVRIEQAEFEAIDYQVMGVAYEVQNQFGRLLQEKIYQAELAERLSSRFDKIELEVPLTVSFDSFSKRFYADLIVDSRVIYELKAAPVLADAHRLQLRQYLLLTDLKHGKLINFGTPKVEGEFVSTSLTPDEQRRFNFDFKNFVSTDQRAEQFRDLMVNLLDAWCGFLGRRLYYEAICHFLGGSEQVICPIQIVSGGRTVGTQPDHLLTESMGFKLTAFKEGVADYQNQLSRFLGLTNMDSIQRINLGGHDVTFTTVLKRS